MKGKGAVIGICAADVVLLAVCIFLYLGQDRTAPVISFSANDVIYSEDMDTGLLLNGVMAVDDEDGDVSDSLLIEKISDTAKGDVIVTYAALDSADNVAKASRIFSAQTGSAGERGRQAESVQDEEKTAPETDTATETGNAAEPDQEAGNRDGENGGENQDGAEAGNNQEEEQRDRQEGNDGQDKQDDHDENGQDAAGADMNQAEVEPENAAPVLRLSKESLTVKAGAESVNWNDCIRSLSDDKDSRAQLFSNLVMEGQVDLDAPGEYPVTIYTKDSEGMESEKKNVVVRVE